MRKKILELETEKRHCEEPVRQKLDESVLWRKGRRSNLIRSVIPECFNRGSKFWIPAFAGMTEPRNDEGSWKLRQSLWDRMLVAILSFCLVFLPVLPSSSISLCAAEPTLDPTGQFVPTIPAVMKEEKKEAEAPPKTDSLANVTDFVMQGGISRVDDEEVSMESNDPFYSTSGSWGQSYDDLWWLKRVQADQAWSISRGTNVPVAVIDTGIDFNHPDLAANVWTNLAELNGVPGVDDDHDGFIDDVHGAGIFTITTMILEMTTDTARLFPA